MDRNNDWITARRKRLRASLVRRYPGVGIGVHYNDGQQGGYKGWCLAFGHADLQVLHSSGVLPDGYPGGDHPGDLEGVFWMLNSDSTGHVAFCHIQEEPPVGARDKALTKTRKAQVMRMLKPFISGTWKPRQTA